MTAKQLPFTKAQVEDIIQSHQTPFHIYDEKGIKKNARDLNAAFSWNKGFKEYFAVKATPNPHILQLLNEENFGADASSLAELILAEKAGIKGEDIMFTSNNTTKEEYEKAKQLRAIINLDDITQIEKLEKLGLPKIISFRYNPGPLRKGNTIIGSPEQAKYGLTKDQIHEAYKTCKEKGITRFGIHTMIASNELEEQYFVETAKMLFDLIQDISQKENITFEFANIGGGIGIPYRPDQKAPDINKISQGIRKEYEARNFKELKLFMENGRTITGPYGYLITKAINHKNTYKHYIGVDSCMANLMRPGMYGAYHHITVLGKEQQPPANTYDIVGSLCENNDKFAIDRKLPQIEENDILVIHDAGAHGHAMGFNYNGKLRSAELLLKEDGSVKQIRRAETIDDYFATLNFNQN